MNVTPEEQLVRWAAGESIHNDDRDECCPDFSCCNPHIHTPLEMRQRFVQAHRKGDERTCDSMLIMFLGGAFPNAYIAGGEPDIDH